MSISIRIYREAADRIDELERQVAGPAMVATCTPAERKLLDAMWSHLRDNCLSGCPYCHYDGLGPGSPEVAAAMKAVADEKIVFTEAEVEKFYDVF